MKPDAAQVKTFLLQLQDNLSQQLERRGWRAVY